MSTELSPVDIEKITAWLGTGSINIFGLPFSGKDTQAQKLSKLFHAPIIGGGDILRNAPHVPERIRKIIGEGKLAPRQDYLKLVIPYLSQPEFAGRPLILSILGRWHGEEQGILRATIESGHPTKAVIYLDQAESVTHERWRAAQTKIDREQRDDDAEGKLDIRLDEFRNKTLPVIDFYRQKHLLIDIDGNQPAEVVTNDILNQLAQLASQT